MPAIEPDFAAELEAAVLKVHDFLPTAVKTAMLLDPVDAALIAGLGAGLGRLLEIVSVLADNDSELKAAETLKASRADLSANWAAKLAARKPPTPPPAPAAP